MPGLHRPPANRSARRPARLGGAARPRLSALLWMIAATCLVSAMVLAAPASVEAQARLHEGRSLAEWVADLGGTDSALRRRAAAALPAFGDAAVPALGQAVVADPDPEVRLEAVKALGRLGPVARPAVPSLVKGMRDRVAYVRRGAAAVLGSVGPATPEGLAALINGLVDPDAGVIDNAAHSLLALGSPSQAPLVRALKEPDGGLRQMAVLTLSAGIRFGKLRPIAPETVRALIDTLGDASPDIRDEAARALADLGPQAKDALPALQRMAAGDPAESVRLVARRAIDRIEARP